MKSLNSFGFIAGAHVVFFSRGPDLRLSWKAMLNLFQVSATLQCAVKLIEVDARVPIAG